ncbi:MAG: hypothetical protein AB7E32_10150 [Desulfovibrio sp.]
MHVREAEDLGLLNHTPDSWKYRRVEARPSAEGVERIRRISD